MEYYPWHEGMKCESFHYVRQWCDSIVFFIENVAITGYNAVSKCM